MTMSLPVNAAPDPSSVWTGIHARVARLLTRPGEAGFVRELSAITDALLRAMDEDPEAGTFEMIHGEELAGYAVAHSLQTAFVASLAARRLGWSMADRRTVAQAALTMNIAMLALQNTLVRQTTPPTLKQRTEIATHPARSRALLEAAGITDTDLLDTVAQHHVTPGGHALPADRHRLNPRACLVHYADVYLAKLSPRATRAAIAVNVAARELGISAGGPDNPYVEAILQEMGAYPPGTFVKLRNGETAIVLRRGPTPDAPWVHSLMREDGSTLPAALRRDTALPLFKVVAALPRGLVMVRLNRQQLLAQATD